MKDTLEACCDPALLSSPLALGTMPVATRVVRVLNVATVLAQVRVAAAFGSLTPDDGTQHLALIGMKSTFREAVVYGAPNHV